MNWKHVRPVLYVVAVLLVYGSGVATARAQYKLNAGDVIEILVAGVPELKHRTTITIDGQVKLPLLDALPAAGQTLDQLEATVREKLPNKMLRQRTADGREYILVINPDEISLTVAEHRPIYMMGDIIKPGEHPFRPGMNVRQAIALAGGAGFSDFGTGRAKFEAIDLRNQYTALAVELAAEKARALRLDAELADKALDSSKMFASLNTAPSLASKLAEGELEQFRVRRGSYRRDEAHLRDFMSKADARVSLLTQQSQQEKEGLDADTADWERVRSLYEKGITSVARVSDARRSVLLSSTRALQTTVQTSLVERDRAEIRNKFEELVDKRRLDALAELRDARVKIANLTARMQSISEKVSYAEYASSSKSRIAVKVFRTFDQKEVAISADETLTLQPGDVVEVVLPRLSQEIAEGSISSEGPELSVVDSRRQ